jgi:hypothetical protein
VAGAYHVNPRQILVGEYGVAQPSGNTLGEPLPTSPAWFSAVLTTAHGMGFAAAAWDLDSGFGITCGQPGSATLCTAYEGVFP